jgi:hypothetical protein
VGPRAGLDAVEKPNIIKAIKSRRMRWAGHVAQMREIEDFKEETTWVTES